MERERGEGRRVRVEREREGGGVEREGERGGIEREGERWERKGGFTQNKLIKQLHVVLKS